MSTDSTAATAAPTSTTTTPTTDISDDLARQYQRRAKVAQEIASSELSYVTSLLALSEAAVGPLQQILTPSEHRAVFSNIVTILQFNQQFHKDIAAKMENWNNDSVIGHVLLQFTPYLKIYQQYVSNHEAAILMLQELEKRSRFQRALTEIMHSPKMYGISSLQSVLIMPIQRIPRYELLFKELLKATPETHEDYCHVQNALDQVKSVAFRVNSEIGAQQSRLEVPEKALLLGLDPATFVIPSRYFIKQGQLTKVCRGKDVTYEFFVFNDVLVYASSGQYKVHNQLPIDAAFYLVEEEEDIDTPQFRIISRVKSFTVYAESVEAKEDWISLLGSLSEAYHAKMTSTPSSPALLTTPSSPSLNHTNSHSNNSPVKLQINTTTATSPDASNLQLSPTSSVANTPRSSLGASTPYFPPNSPSTPISNQPSAPTTTRDQSNSISVLSSSQQQQQSQPADIAGRPPSGSSLSTKPETIPESEPLTLSLPVLMPYSASNACLCCSRPFGLLHSKKHCHFCGNLVCSSCSRGRKLLNGNPERICRDCTTADATGQRAPSRSRAQSVNRAQRSGSVARPRIGSAGSNGQSSGGAGLALPSSPE